MPLVALLQNAPRCRSKLIGVLRFDAPQHIRGEVSLHHSGVTGLKRGPPVAHIQDLPHAGIFAHRGVLTFW